MRSMTSIGVTARKKSMELRLLVDQARHACALRPATRPTHSASAAPSRTATPRLTASVASASVLKARSSVRIAFGRSP